MLMPRRREADPGGPSARRGQTYAWGWVVAISCLTRAISLDLLEAHGATVGLAHSVVSLIVGIAAAAGKAWSWFVLLAAQVLLVAYGTYYMAVIAREPHDKTIVAVGAVALSVLQFVYFYKRRAMFGARWRWERLERRHPQVVGPETRDPDHVPGFAGLSHPRRLLFIMVLVVGIGLELVAWLSPREPAPVNDDEQERQVTLRRIEDE